MKTALQSSGKMHIAPAVERRRIRRGGDQQVKTDQTTVSWERRDLSSLVCSPEGLNTQTIRNLRQLVRCRLALPGVGDYLFCQDLEWLELRQLSQSRRQAAKWPLLSLLEEPAATASVLLIPADWSAGLAEGIDQPVLAEIEAHTSAAQAPDLWRQVKPDGPQSVLSRQLSAYVQACETCPSPDHLVELLRRETKLRRQFSSRLWRSLGARTTCSAMASLTWQRQHGLQLAAVIHLLPTEEQAPWLKSMVQELHRLLNHPDRCEEGLELAQWLLGSVNSRNPALIEIAGELRQRAIQVAAAQRDATARARALMALIDTPTRLTKPAVVTDLVAAIEELVIAMRQQPALTDAERKHRRAELHAVITAASTNIWLLHAVVLNLGERVSRVLPAMLSQESSCQLLQALLLITTDDVHHRPKQAERLTQLGEDLLARLWWTENDILRLIHGLRRFQLELGWLWKRSHLLQGMVKMYTGGAIGSAMVPAQLMGLGRLSADPQIRLKLHRLLNQLSQDQGPCKEYNREERKILEAMTCGQDAAACSTLRLLASSLGVSEIMPMPSSPTLAADDGAVAQRWRHCLDHWQLTFTGADRQKPAPVCVVITSFNPCIELLSMAIESLLNQTAPPLEILVIDDGSTQPFIDDLINQLPQAERSCTKVRYHRNAENQGQYRCRNMAAVMTRQPYIAIQDDDDISHPTRLAIQCETAASGAIATYCRHIRVNSETGELQADGDANQFLGDGITTLLIDRKTVCRMGGFYPVRSRGDVEFRTRLKQVYGKSSIAYDLRPLYLMRGSSATVSSTFEYGCSLQLKTWRHLIRKSMLA